MTTNTFAEAAKKMLFVALGACGMVAAGSYIAWADDVAEQRGACVPQYGTATDGTMFDVAHELMEAAADRDTDRVRCISWRQYMSEQEAQDQAEATITSVPEGASISPAIYTEQGGNAGLSIFDVDGTEVRVNVGCTLYRPWWSPDALYMCTARTDHDATTP